MIFLVRIDQILVVVGQVFVFSEEEGFADGLIHSAAVAVFDFFESTSVLVTGDHV